MLSIVSWAVLGLISGFVASKIIDGPGDGLRLDVALGTLGALAGGFAFNLVTGAGMSGFNVWSFFGSIAGSVLIVAVYRYAYAYRQAFA
ncbi:MAG: GlsB/YeaQ/YmgE family stress response membrane protein [Deltaproteobacteria bacterium]